MVSHSNYVFQNMEHHGNYCDYGIDYDAYHEWRRDSIFRNVVTMFLIMRYTILIDEWITSN